MIPGYTINTSVQILISLLRKYGIKKAVVSPGTTNLEFVAGMQYCGDFEMYSSVDERSAAYMACGMAAASGEPVIITCTEATASRDYYPGLTEAYYRKLPVLAVTGVHRYYQIGHLKPQIIDRSASAKDALRFKVQLPIIKDKEDEAQTEILVNEALLELSRNGGGPVHIDLPCCNDQYEFDIKKLPDSRLIQRYETLDKLPALSKGRIAIFIGSHNDFSEKETKLIDKFCGQNNAVVFCDHTSGYYGEYAFHAGLLSTQKRPYSIFDDIELLIHIGGPSGDGSTMSRMNKAKEVWRVNPDGELRDTFGSLTCIFQMSEKEFFSRYIIASENGSKKNDLQEKEYLKECIEEKERLVIDRSQLPLSSVYVASVMAHSIPSGSYIHLGVSNTIRAWDLFDFPKGVKSGSNVGCRGIDGIMSAFIGTSLIYRNKICFCVVGDLMFFYDMNALGNRDIKPNVRILLINNNGGGVMKLQGAPGYRFFGDADTDKYIAAAGHFGNQSKSLVKNYVESLGFDYMSADSKEDFNKKYPAFVSGKERTKPLLFEVFNSGEDDREAFNVISTMDASKSDKAKDLAKNILGEKGVSLAKKILHK